MGSSGGGQKAKKYTRVFTAEYVADLKGIEADPTTREIICEGFGIDASTIRPGYLGTFLSCSVYWLLDRAPQLGAETFEPGYYIVRQWVVDGRLSLVVTYWINEQRREYVLDGIKRRGDDPVVM